MVGLLLPADFLHTPGPILREVGTLVPLAIVFGSLVTAIYLIGLTVRRKPRIGRLGIDSGAEIVCYLLSLVVYLAAR